MDNLCTNPLFELAVIDTTEKWDSAGEELGRLAHYVAQLPDTASKEQYNYYVHQRKLCAIRRYIKAHGLTEASTQDFFRRAELLYDLLHRQIVLYGRIESKPQGMHGTGYTREICHFVNTFSRNMVLNPSPTKEEVKLEAEFAEWMKAKQQRNIAKVQTTTATTPTTTVWPRTDSASPHRKDEPAGQANTKLNADTISAYEDAHNTSASFELPGRYNWDEEDDELTPKFKTMSVSNATPAGAKKQDSSNGTTSATTRSRNTHTAAPKTEKRIVQDADTGVKRIEKVAVVASKIPQPTTSKVAPKPTPDPALTALLDVKVLADQRLDFFRRKAMAPTIAAANDTPAPHPIHPENKAAAELFAHFQGLKSIGANPAHPGHYSGMPAYKVTVIDMMDKICSHIANNFKLPEKSELNLCRNALVTVEKLIQDYKQTQASRKIKWEKESTDFTARHNVTKEKNAESLARKKARAENDLVKLAWDEVKSTLIARELKLRTEAELKKRAEEEEAKMKQDAKLMLEVEKKTKAEVEEANMKKLLAEEANKKLFAERVEKTNRKPSNEMEKYEIDLALKKKAQNEEAKNQIKAKMQEAKKKRALERDDAEWDLVDEDDFMDSTEGRWEIVGGEGEVVDEDESD